MPTYKYQNNDLIPINDWHQQQAKRHQEQQIDTFIEPQPADIMPAKQTAIAYNPADMLAPSNAHHVKEVSTPVERSKAFSIRYASIGFVLLLLALGVVWAAAGTVIMSYVLALFGVLAVIAFIALTRYDYRNSTYNNERHRISELSTILDNESSRIHDREMERMRLNHELQLAKLETLS